MKLLPKTLFGTAAVLICTSSLSLVAEEEPLQLKLEKIADGFVAPVGLESHPAMPDHLLVVDQAGEVKVVKPDGSVSDEPFLDVRDRLTKLRPGFDERGLLGLAFHPDFSENHKVFVYYSGKKSESLPEGWDHTSHVSEYTVKKDNPLEADPASEKVILHIDQPHFNHNGGMMRFGKDGFLYIATGDGGGGNGFGKGHVPMGNSQDPNLLLGKILRIAPDGNGGYTIPADNPFANGEGGKKEIYAMGIRNPWGFSIDHATGRAITADVGQNRFAEINVIERGANYGWNLREGYDGFDPKKPMELS
ncbi:MAG: PQQ-dependent sugar dehydrogenase, partial [Verrucomicrobiota bacterium]